VRRSFPVLLAAAVLAGCGDGGKPVQKSSQPPARARLAVDLTNIKIRDLESPGGPSTKTITPIKAFSLCLLEAPAGDVGPDLKCSLVFETTTTEGEFLVVHANPQTRSFHQPVSFRGRRWLVENADELLGLVGQAPGKEPAAASMTGQAEKANPWELREVTRAEVLRVYQRCESDARSSGCPPASMGMFEIAMKKASPKVVPILVELIGTAPVSVSRQHIVHSIYAIDVEHGTNHYVELLISKNVDEKYRLMAVANIAGYGRGTAEKLDRLASDPERPEDERARARSMATRIAEAVREDPQTTEKDRSWARTRLVVDRDKAK